MRVCLGVWLASLKRSLWENVSLIKDNINRINRMSLKYNSAQIYTTLLGKQDVHGKQLSVLN